MTKQFCDRCRTDITSKVSGRLDGVADADANGNGKVRAAAVALGQRKRHRVGPHR